MAFGTQMENIVQEYILKTDGAVANAGELFKQFKGLEAQGKKDAYMLEQMGLGVSKLDKAFSGLTGSLTVANLTSSAITATVGALKSAISDVLSEGLKWEDKVGSNTQALRAMSEATAGMASGVAIASVREKMLTGDLKLTEEQLTAVAKGSVLLARVMNVDVDQALTQVSDSIISGRGLEKALKQMGIQIDLIGTDAEKSAQALKAMADRTAELKIATENSSENIEALGSAWKDFAGQLGAAITSSGIMVGVTKALTAELRTMQSVLSGGAAKDSSYERKRAIVMGAGLSPEKTAAILKRLERVKAGLPMDEPSSSQTGQGAMDEMFADTKTIESAWSFVTAGGGKDVARKAGGARRGANSPWPLADDPNKWLALDNAEQEKLRDQAWEKSLQYAQAYAEILSKTTDLLVENQNAAAEDAASRGAESSGREEMAEGLRGRSSKDGLTKGKRGLAGALGKLIIDDKLVKWAGQSDDNLKELTATIDNLAVHMEDFTVGSLANFAGGMWAAADAALTSGASFGEVMKVMLKETLLSIASQATVQAVFETAKGLASLASWDIPGASQHFASAAMFGTTAALAGSVGLAMSAAGVGRQAEKAEKAERPSSRRESFGRRADNEPRKTTINLYLGNKGDLAARIYMNRELEMEMGKAA